MDNRINNKPDEYQPYIAKVSNGWAILIKGKVIKVFDTEQKLLKSWNEDAPSIEGEHYVLERKKPPLPKIGDVFFEHKYYEYLRLENFTIETDKNKINLITKTGNILAVFESQSEFENWQLKYIKWRQKKGKSPGYISSVKMEASKENNTRKNFTSTDEYKNMQDDSDWWREQS